LTTTSALWGSKEIAELPYIIRENEEIFGLVHGVYNAGPGILVATSLRLLFVDKELLYGLKVEDFRLDHIASIQYEAGAGIKVTLIDDIIRISNVERIAGRAFCEKVLIKLAEPGQAKALVAVVQQHMGSSHGRQVAH
jgi:hypothetical protein